MLSVDYIYVKMTTFLMGRYPGGFERAIAIDLGYSLGIVYARTVYNLVSKRAVM